MLNSVGPRERQEFLKMVIDTVLLLAHQNIPYRSDDKDGNFLEILEHISKDADEIFKSELEKGKCISGKIQNEILSIEVWVIAVHCLSFACKLLFLFLAD